MGNRDFARFGFKMSFRRISYITQPPEHHYWCPGAVCSALMTISMVTWTIVAWHDESCETEGPAGARSTDGISIKFEIWPKFAVLWFKIYSRDHNKVLHSSRNCYCCDGCKISLWSAENVMNKSIAKFHLILNWIKISIVGRAPGHTAKWNQKG